MRIFILLFLCGYFGWGNAAFGKAKQPVSLPETDFANFTDSSIKVHSTIGSAFVTLYPEDCKYIFPTAVLALNGWCNKSCFEKSTDVCTDWKSEKSSDYNEGCLCARQVTVCNKSTWIQGASLGCVKFLPLPMPPPFFETLVSLPKINVIPVKSSGYSNPKLRVIISTLTQKIAYNVTYPDLANYNIQTDVLSREDGKDGSVTVEKRLARDKVCAKVVQVFGTDIDSQREYCFDRYGSLNYSGLQICSSGKGLCLGNKKVPFFRPLIFMGNEKRKCRGPLCRNGFFDGGYVCVETASEGLSYERRKDICGDGRFSIDNEGNLHCHNKSAEVCSSGYRAKMRYKDDPDGNMICLKDAISFPERYLAVINDRVVLFSEGVKKFIPYKAEGSKSVPSDDPVLDIPYTSQSILDSLRSDGGRDFYTLEHESKFGAYRYEADVMNCLEADLDGQGGCNDSFRAFDEIKGSLNSSTTPFFDVEGRAFFLPEDSEENQYSKNQCGGGLCYVPASPLYSGLCLLEESSGDCYQYEATMAPFIKGETVDKIAFQYATMPFVTVENPITKFTNSCEIVQIDAVGGGAGTTISNGITVEGSSGEYSAVTMAVEDFVGLWGSDKVLLPVVGFAGGETGSGNSDGGDTVLYVCERRKEDCSSRRPSVGTLPNCGYVSDRYLYDSIVSLNEREDFYLNDSQKGNISNDSRIDHKRGSSDIGSMSKSDSGRIDSRGSGSSDIGVKITRLPIASAIKRIRIRRERLVKHNINYIKNHCKVLVAAKGGRVIRSDVDQDFERFGSHFEDKFLYKIYRESFPPREIGPEECVPSIPYIELETFQPMYSLSQKELCNFQGYAPLFRSEILTKMFSKVRPVGCKKRLRYGRGGCRHNYCESSGSLQGHRHITSEKQRRGGAGVIRFACHKLKNR